MQRFAVWFIAILLFLPFGLRVFSFQTSSIFFTVPAKSVEEGNRVTVDVRVDSKEQAMNAVSGEVIYSSDLIRPVAVSKAGSIISLWTREPKILRDRVVFEGVAMNPGYQGPSGLVLRITFEAKKVGDATVDFGEGAILANDGLGTNILASLQPNRFKIIPHRPAPTGTVITLDTKTQTEKLVALPVITDYSSLVTAKEKLYLKGKGEPNALTKIVFKDVSLKSIGERLIEVLQTRKKKLEEVLVQNDESGVFEYVSPQNLVAGVYNATPFLVEEETRVEKPGLGVQLLVNDSKIVKILVVVINVLGLLIPIVLLCVIIYFIPWYSWLRMKILKKKMKLEEEKLDVSGHQLERQDKILDKTVDKLIEDDNVKGE